MRPLPWLVLIASATAALADDEDLHHLDVDAGQCLVEDVAPRTPGNARETARLALDGPGVPAPFTRAVTRYLGAYCDRYNRSRNECLGTAQGFTGALLEELGMSLPENLRSGRRADYFNYSSVPADARFRGTLIADLDGAGPAAALTPGTLIHTRCHCYAARAYVPDDDAHHWVVYAGARDGTQYFFDNVSMYRGCPACKTLYKEKTACSRIQTCLDECRRRHREAGHPPSDWCDPERPDPGCLNTLGQYASAIDGWANTRTYCRPAMPDAPFTRSCVHGIVDPISGL